MINLLNCFESKYTFKHDFNLKFDSRTKLKKSLLRQILVKKMRIKNKNILIDIDFQFIKKI